MGLKTKLNQALKFSFILSIPLTFLFILFKSTEIIKYVVSYFSQNYNITLVTLNPYEAFLLTIKITLTLTSIIYLPLIIIYGLLYISNALYNEEKKIINYVPLMTLLGLIGGYLGYTVLTRYVFPYLISFNNMTGMNVVWNIDSVIQLSLQLVFAFALVFQLPILMIILNNTSLVNTEDITKSRKYIIFIAMIISATITPPDIISMIIMVIPILLLFEITLLYLKWKNKKT